MDILKELTILQESHDSLAYNLEEGYDERYPTECAHIKHLGKIETVYSKGGCEGGGDEAVRVFKFIDHGGICVKITGYYSSYEGTEWNGDWKEVKPQEKTITVYV